MHKDVRSTCMSLWCYYDFTVVGQEASVLTGALLVERSTVLFVG